MDNGLHLCYVRFFRNDQRDSVGVTTQTYSYTRKGVLRRTIVKILMNKVSY